MVRIEKEIIEQLEEAAAIIEKGLKLKTSDQQVRHWQGCRAWLERFYQLKGSTWANKGSDKVTYWEDYDMDQGTYERYVAEALKRIKADRGQKDEENGITHLPAVKSDIPMPRVKPPKEKAPDTVADKIEQFLNVRAEFLQRRSPLLRKHLDIKYDSLLAAIDPDRQEQIQQVKDLYNEARGF